MTAQRREDPATDDHRSWHQHASCRHVDPDMFFVESERGPTRRRLIEQAKAVCDTCPVFAACLAHGLSSEEPFGIWGGLTVAERDSVLRRRRRVARRALTAR